MKTNTDRQRAKAADADLAERLRELYRAALSTDDLEDVEHALTGLAGGLLNLGGPSVADFAAALYQLARDRWTQNRAAPDAEQWTPADDEQMSMLHGWLVAAVERAEQDAETGESHVGF